MGKKFRVDIVSTLFVLFFAITACTDSEGEALNGLRDLRTENKHAEFFLEVDRIVAKNPRSPIAEKAAEAGYEVAFFETEDFKRTAKYLRYLLISVRDEKKRLRWHQRLARIYFDQLADYPKAILEYHRLLQIPHSTKEENLYRLALGKANYALSEFDQALVEVETLLKKKDLTADDRFAVLVLKGNILVGQKKMDRAIELYQKVIAEFPTRANREGLPLNLSMCFEEKGQFLAAIEVLDTFIPRAPDPNFVELRIQRLQERQRRSPGALGYRK